MTLEAIGVPNSSHEAKKPAMTYLILASRTYPEKVRNYTVNF
jgi:hypothetical protein